MIKKFIQIFICSVILIFTLTGCERKYVMLDDVDILNYTAPVQNEEIAVISIKDYGDIKIKLFPEQCPKGVENFKRLITEKNYYDGVAFHRIINGFMIQSGDPTGTGAGGESIWNEGFSQEISSGLRHFSGAVSYATADDKLNGSQFFIVTGQIGFDFSEIAGQGYYFPANVAKTYNEKGGYPSLDGKYEVFGQVFEGMDICFKIAEVPTDENDRPVQDIIIEKAEIIPFSE